jgi:3-methyladenine DNA glycosylase/8-oxoguanine DNA glycosylase
VSVTQAADAPGAGTFGAGMLGAGTAGAATAETGTAAAATADATTAEAATADAATADAATAEAAHTGPDPDTATGDRDSPAGAEDCRTLDWEPPFRLNLALTLIVHRRGPGDPTFRIDPTGAIWRTSLTPAGPATLRLAWRQPGVVRAAAWGPGADWLVAAVPDLLGAQDQPADFRPDHPALRQLVRQFDGLRISRTQRVLEALVPAVLEQKVVSLEAHRAWRSLLRRFGLPAPGPAPAGMRVFPPPAVWRSIPSFDWHRAGVEAVRARTIAGAASVAGRLEEVCAIPAAEADRRLQSLPGIGPWTSAEVRQRACGDADAVSVGDYHIPGLVGWLLTGEPADDARMLELLAPYAGQRYRASRLIELAGSQPPRRAPKSAVRDYRAF